MTDNLNENTGPIDIAEVKRLAGIDPNTYKVVEFMQPTFVPPAVRRRQVLAEAANRVNGSAGGGRAGIASVYILESDNNIDEGSALSFAISGTNITNGTYYWTVQHITTADADFDAVSGSVTISNNSGSFTISPTADTSTEGAQTFSVYLRSGSITGPVVAVLTNITVNDTSLSAPTYNWTAPSGFTGYYTFNGTNQRLSMPGNADLSPGTGDFTVEFIIRKAATGGGSFPRLFSVGVYPSAKVACSIEGGAHVYFWINGQIAADVDCGSLAGFPAFNGNWHHIALQRKSGVCQIYVDGNKVGNTTVKTANIDCSTTQFDFATESAAGATYANWFKGDITNFRWTTAAVYDNSFPVPSAELTDLANTQLLLTMSTSGAGLTDTGGSPAHTVTAVNAPVYHSYP